MADSNEEWELSKENIQPIQQGRKQKVLKVALAPNAEDLILQQKQAFEYELRTYNGDDPLFVWCKYIKWVEQNFPKGGKDGHIMQLIEKCISILKDNEKYYNDERFIDILLKFANMNVKPLEIYNYMYCHKIGCKSANFFIKWSEELEKLGNIKKANEVLTEGINHRAEPAEAIKYRADELKKVAMICKIKELETNNFETYNQRSVFNNLIPQKKNLAPISRVGEAVVDNKRTPLILGRQQPQPRSVNVPAKVPFKIYNAENIVSSLPVQSNSLAPPILNSENYKENEQKPSKWNKVRVKPNRQVLRLPTDANPGFKFHCDEDVEQLRTPRSVPKTSSVLSDRGRSPSPPMALFEPPDPLKIPMYPKNKVYGGAEEYSLEEIRAAEWFERKKKKDQELLLLEQQKQIEEQAKKEAELEKKIQSLAKQVELLQSNFLSIAPKSCKIPNASEINSRDIRSEYVLDENKEFGNLHLTRQRNKRSESENIGISGQLQNYSHYLEESELKNNSENMFSSRNNIHKSNSVTDTFESKCIDSTAYREVDKMVQELYNKTLSHSVNEFEDKMVSKLNFEIDKKGIGTSSSNNYLPNLAEIKDSEKRQQNNLPFACFHDPIEEVLSSNEQKDTDEIQKNNFFTCFHDPTEEVPSLSNVVFSENISIKELPKNYQSGKSPRELTNENSSEENIENIPPKGYIQERTKRELSGVLEPSKNILFIPLEEQEEMQDDSEDEDAYIRQGGMQHTDETLVPPSNTEQFSTAAFLASTPCTSKKSDKKASLAITQSEIAPLDADDVSQNVYLSKVNSQNYIKEQVSIENCVAKTEAKQSLIPRLQNVLSVIMETSSENYSKSSSSSGSVNLTKSSHLDPSASHFNSIRKPYLKQESNESCALRSVLEVPDDTSVVNDEINSISYQNKVKHDNDHEIKIYSVDFDPFDPDLIQKLLKSVNIKNYKNLFHVNKSLRSIKVGENINVENTVYRIERLIAEGAYAKVFEAVRPFLFSGGSTSNPKIAFKICKNGNEWEFYICNEIQKRLTESLPDIKNSVMNVTLAVKYSDGIILANEYGCLGTLLDVVNFYKQQNSSIPELIVMYLTLEILHIVSKLHELNIIHGDIKPDNFLLMNNAFDCDVLDTLAENITSLRLIDFGRAVDLNLFDKGICFTSTFSTTHFKCNEMKENKPWVFQLDWYGVISCIHTMLFSEYMVVRKTDGKWGIEKKFKRYWFTSLWESLFSELLNIPQCYKEPDIKPFVCMIKTKLQQNSKSFISQIIRLSSTYSAK